MDATALRIDASNGAAPTAFAGPPSWVPNQSPGVYYMWFNVAHGTHTINVSLPGSTTPIASEDVYVDSGGFTVVAGVSPQPVQP